MNEFSLKEFRPTILFLGKFIGIYVVLNVLYGLFVSSFNPRPDPFTSQASSQTAFVLGTFGWDVQAPDNKAKATTEIIYGGHNILSVYEGCNGINVMIIFVAFLFGFGPITRTLIWFVPAGIIIIHLANLARIASLFWIALYQPDFMYFIHKYLFTAVLYVVVFILWIVWVRRFSRFSSAAGA